MIINYIKNKKVLLLAVVFLSTVVIFGGVENVYAGPLEIAVDALGYALRATVTSIIMLIAEVCILVLGTLITAIVWAITHISQYNNFIQASYEFYPAYFTSRDSPINQLYLSGAIFRDTGAICGLARILHQPASSLSTND